MKITFEGVDNLLPKGHTHVVDVMMNIGGNKGNPKNVRIEIEDNLVVNDTFVTEYVDVDELEGEGKSFEMASPRGKINGPTGKFQSEVLSSITESQKNSVLQK